VDLKWDVLCTHGSTHGLLVRSLFIAIRSYHLVLTIHYSLTPVDARSQNSLV
jgi:hypothetical protein